MSRVEVYLVRVALVPHSIRRIMSVFFFIILTRMCVGEVRRLVVPSELGEYRDLQGGREKENLFSNLTGSSPLCFDTGRLWNLRSAAQNSS